MCQHPLTRGRRAITVHPIPTERLSVFLFVRLWAVKGCVCYERNTVLLPPPSFDHRMNTAHWMGGAVRSTRKTFIESSSSLTHSHTPKPHAHIHPHM